MLKVSSSVSNKRPQQPSDVGPLDPCGGSVNGEKIVAAFQAHMQIKYHQCGPKTGNTGCVRLAGRFHTSMFRVVTLYSSQYVYSVVNTHFH